MNCKYNIWNKWDPLKTVVLGDCYAPEFFRDIKNSKIRSALTQISEETQQDLEYFESVLKDFGCTVLRPQLDSNDSILNYIDTQGRVTGEQGVPRAPLQPRDCQIIAGNCAAITGQDHSAIADILFQYSTDTIDLRNQALPEYKYNQIMCSVSGDWPTYNDYKQNCKNQEYFKPHVWQELQSCDYDAWSTVNSASSFPVGNKMYASSEHLPNREEQQYVEQNIFNDFETVWHNFDGHTDGNFHPIKPGAILSLHDVQTYQETFPNWDVCYLPDQSWSKVSGFNKIKQKVAGKWWVPEQEHNDEFTNFVETWLNDWVGYVEETVFDVNVLVLDQHHVCVNNMNPAVINFLKKHNIEPVHVPWRHRYFWDGGLHCITLDLYREGVQQDYFNN